MMALIAAAGPSTTLIAATLVAALVAATLATVATALMMALVAALVATTLIAATALVAAALAAVAAALMMALVATLVSTTLIAAGRSALVAATLAAVATALMMALIAAARRHAGGSTRLLDRCRACAARPHGCASRSHPAAEVGPGERWKQCSDGGSPGPDVREPRQQILEGQARASLRRLRRDRATANTARLKQAEPAASRRGRQENLPAPTGCAETEQAGPGTARLRKRRHRHACEEQPEPGKRLAEERH